MRLKKPNKRGTMTANEKLVNYTLHNDESASDQELVDYFCDNGLTLDEARYAICQRDKCLQDMYYEVKL